MPVEHKSNPQCGGLRSRGGTLEQSIVIDMDDEYDR